MADENVEPISGSGAEPADAQGSERSSDATRWAFLPIGVTFMVLGISQGLGDGGTAFFVIGIAFLTLALTGVNLRRGEGREGGGPSDGGLGGEPDGPDDQGLDDPDDQGPDDPDDKGPDDPDDQELDDGSGGPDQAPQRD